MDGEARLHRPIAECFTAAGPLQPGEAEANAAIIVQAVNALDPLVAALTTLRAKFHCALVIGGTDPEFAEGGR